MPEESGYERMEELAERLRKGVADLVHGRADALSVGDLTEDARLLHERLIVLRHKARELATGKQPVKPNEEPMSIRLDTKPPVHPVAQTSLIDAIAETEVRSDDRKVTAPVAVPRGRKALPKVITLSEKFWFLKELFGGDAQRYDRAIAALDDAADAPTALASLNDLVAGGNKPVAEDALQALKDAVQRAFPA